MDSLEKTTMIARRFETQRVDLEKKGYRRVSDEEVELCSLIGIDRFERIVKIAFEMTDLSCKEEKVDQRSNKYSERQIYMRRESIKNYIDYYRAHGKDFVERHVKMCENLYINLKGKELLSFIGLK